MQAPSGANPANAEAASPRVTFRVDASVTIGTGHIMRCLTLADALRGLSADSSFLLGPGDPAWIELVRARGFQASSLSPEARGNQPEHLWLPWGWEADATATRAALRRGTDWLVVDHYALDARWEQALRGDARHILAIDDLGDRRHDADLVLDANLQAPARYTGRVPARTRLLLGPAFALLQPGFARFRRIRTGEVRRMVVFMGGADAAGATQAALNAIDLAGLRDLPLTVVTGAANPHLAELRADIGMRPAALLEVDTPRMAELCDAADLAIGAGGVAALERCCQGLPSITLATADNQKPGLDQLAEAGAVTLASEWRGDGTDAPRLAQLLAVTAGDQAVLRAMSLRALEITDGLGARRVAASMMHLARALILRDATEDDAAILHAWRNHPEVRAVSIDMREIPWSEHLVWFNQILADPAANQVLLACLGSVPVGTLRSRREGDRAVLSITTDPALRGLGLGQTLLRAGLERLEAAPDAPAIFEARVLSSNGPSRAVFERAGFQALAAEGALVLYTRSARKGLPATILC